MKYEPEIIALNYDWDNDKWELVVYVKSRLLDRDDCYKKIYDDEESAEKGKQLLLKRLSTIEDGKVEESLIGFGVKKT